MYTKDGFEHCESPDICINVDGEFESLFIEIKSVEHKIILGEIYRIPCTSEKTPISHFNNILEKLYTEKCDQILATDKIFCFPKLISKQIPLIYLTYPIPETLFQLLLSQRE